MSQLLASRRRFAAALDSPSRRRFAAALDSPSRRRFAYAFVVAASFASGAFAQGKPATDPAASQVPAPPPVKPAAAAPGDVPAPPATKPAPTAAPAPAAARPGQAPTAVPTAPGAAQPAPESPTAQPATTPPPAQAPAAQGPPPPPTFPQGAAEPPSTTSSVEVSGQTEELPPPPPEAEPLGWFGLTLSLGYAFGGDEVAAASFTNGADAEISAGTGTQIGFGIVVMPLRSAGHSLGLSVDQSVKYADISARNLSIALTRFPLVVAGRYSYAISETWHFSAGGGLVYEYGINLSGEGDAEDIDVDFENAAGFMVEAGAAYRERSFVIDVTLRFTGLTYQPEIADADELDAKNGALVVAGHYFF